MSHDKELFISMLSYLFFHPMEISNIIDTYFSSIEETKSAVNIF